MPRSYRIAFLLLPLTIFPIGNLLSADWRLTKRLELGVTWSDNITLGVDDQEAGLIGEVSPSVFIVGNGNRSDVFVVAGVGYENFSGSRPDTVTPELFVSTQSNLIENLLFFEASSRVSEEYLGAFTADAAIAEEAGTSTRIYEVSLSPYVVHQFGSFASFRTQYEHGQIKTSDEDVDDSASDSFDISLEHDPNADGVPWNLAGSYQKNRFANDDFLEQRRVTAGTGYAWQSWLFTVDAGREWARQQSSSGDAAIVIDEGNDSVFIWDLGLRWRPSERTGLSVGYGERFFGRRPWLSLEHEGRNSSISLSWSRAVTEFQSRLADTTAGQIETGIRPVPGAGADGSFPGNSGQIIPQGTLAVEEQIRASYQLDGRRHTLFLDSVYSMRERNNAQDHSTNLELRVAVRRRLSARWSVTSEYEYNTGDSQLTSGNYIENRVGVRLNWEL